MGFIEKGQNGAVFLFLGGADPWQEQGGLPFVLSSLKVERCMAPLAQHWRAGGIPNMSESDLVHFASWRQKVIAFYLFASHPGQLSKPWAQILKGPCAEIAVCGRGLGESTQDVLSFA